MSAEFTLYAIGCETQGGVSSEHAYVLSSDGHNWNCFGRGKEAVGQFRVVRTANASSKWASLIYGPNEGQEGSGAAGLIGVDYDGVCQNAANRILVLAGDDVDARGTKGNALATLMYGKFGFNIPQYIDLVKTAGGQVVSTGEIKLSDVQDVLDRINRGLLPDAELQILHEDLKEQENVALPEITDAQRSAFCPIYHDYQMERGAVFDAAPKELLGQKIAYTYLARSLAAPLANCVGRLVAALGVDQFKMMFGLGPDVLIQKLAAAQVANV